MPWKTSSLVEARKRFVQSALRGQQSIAARCAQAGISQKTGFKWLQRFRSGGGPALRDRSRRPRRSPRRTLDRWRRASLALRRQHPRWGPKKIAARLRRLHPRARLPQARTLARWLPRLPIRQPRRIWARRGPPVPRPAQTPANAPNQVWTVDFKGWFRTRDGRRVDPLTVRDLYSRFILGIRLLSYRHQPVRQYFQALFKRYGLPVAIRTDHGSPFAGDGALELTRLSAWWLRLGIRVEFTRRGCPQDNGAHEQMHRVYQAELTQPPAATPGGQQWRTTRWVQAYDYHRPHEALDQQVPAQWYRPSRRRYPTRLAPLRYRRHWLKRRVGPSGHVRWLGRWRVIGRAFSGAIVGFKPGAPGRYEVYFGRYRIGDLVDAELSGLRPATWRKA